MMMALVSNLLQLLLNRSCEYYLPREDLFYLFLCLAQVVVSGTGTALLVSECQVASADNAHKIHKKLLLS